MSLKQKTCYMRTVLLAVMVLASGNVGAAFICDSGLCDCYPSNKYTTTVVCSCNTSRKDFDFTAANFGWKLATVREFNLSDCDGKVTFRMNAFKDLRQLENLNVEGVRKVEFESGVFHKLTKLNLQRIQELNFGERAFMGAQDLHSITISRATVPQLPLHSLFNIKGLHSLELSHVLLHYVEKDAINIDLELSESQVLVNNCTIDNIESNGIALKAKNFSIVKSVLSEISPNAININSSETVLISESDFRRPLPTSAFKIAAPAINISSNTFNSLSSGIMGTTKYKDSTKFIFINNTVYNIGQETLGRIISLIETAVIRGNHLPCKCLLGVFSVPLDFSQNNFCTVKCNISLSDFDALTRERKFCASTNSEDPDEAEICTRVTLSTPRSPRGGTLPYFRTTQGPPSTTASTANKLRNNSGRIQIVYVLLFLTLCSMLFKP